MLKIEPNRYKFDQFEHFFTQNQSKPNYDTLVTHTYFEK